MFNSIFCSLKQSSQVFKLLYLSLIQSGQVFNLCPVYTYNSILNHSGQMFNSICCSLKQSSQVFKLLFFQFDTEWPGLQNPWEGQPKSAPFDRKPFFFFLFEVDLC